MLIRLMVALLLCCWLTLPAMAGPKTASDKIADAFMQLDNDASDSVSFAEYKTMVDERASNRFNEMDANLDGQVSDAEYRTFWRTKKAKWYRLNR